MASWTGPLQRKSSRCCSADRLQYYTITAMGFKKAIRNNSKEPQQLLSKRCSALVLRQTLMSAYG